MSVIRIAALFLCLFIPAFGHAEDAPKRIVSLAPAVTEILYSLGVQDRVAGVTTFCDYPPEAKEKPKVGGMSNPSLEAVVSLRPDIVVMTTDGNPREFQKRLQSLNIKTYVMRARRIHELAGEIRAMGARLGAGSRADGLAGEIEGSLIKFGRAKTGRSLRVLFVIWPEPLIVAGPGTAIDDAIRLLGHKNIASPTGINYPKYSMEEAIRQAPDVIVIGRGHEDMKKLAENLLKRLKGTPAVKNNKVFFVGDGLYRLTPRVIQGIEELSGALR
ncbi:MAG: helical backbone metal receptor [Thermodesulfovibrionales bacterium]|nr:helical backbone metal receptor [Thermodesulfovibrionales bacterium]